MACKTSYELHHHFPKLADESGFTFNNHRPRVHIDWNKIKLIDIESLIRERKFVLIEQHINDILDCVLESEFDVRILDDGVLKMFRLAQLAVEYQQFCRHYLDRSVYVLRQEINSLAQDLAITKQNLQDKEEELRKLRKRTRHTYKTPLPYGNDNIAAMILKTLNNTGDLYATTSRGDIGQYNKCKHCEKIFLNQLYLQSHITRRHPNQKDLPERETNNDSHVDRQNNEITILNAEIIELKSKLKEMEALIVNFNKQNVSPVGINESNTINNDNNKQTITKYMKDAEVSTNNEDYLLNKIEEWKNEEHDKYNKEINILRNQIMETINSFKQNETKSKEKDANVLDQLRSTILEQGAEIVALKQKLKDSEKYTENKNSERINEAEEQITFWANRAETQSKQYESLLLKLNDATKEATQSRQLAESERKRAEQLQMILKERNDKDSEKSSSPYTVDNTTKIPSQDSKNDIVDKSTPNQFSKNQSPIKSIKVTDRETLDNLHRKAQELLNMGSLSSSLSDSSSIDRNKVTSTKHNHILDTHQMKPHLVNHNKNNSKKEEKHNNVKHVTADPIAKLKNYKERKMRNKPKMFMNGMINESPMDTGSPLKVVRAKLTEEVNSRLVQLGVDPLKSRLPQNIFHSQREHLQKHQEMKSKKNPSHEKIRYSILAYLDSSTANKQNCISSTNKYSMQNKKPKPFRSLTSLISGVKSKAISLVKSNDANIKEQRKTFGSEVAKRAILLIKTPPGSAPNSPSQKKPSSSKSINSPTNDSHEITLNHGNTGVLITDHKKLAKAGKRLVNKSDSNESLESGEKYYNTTNVEKSIKDIHINTIDTLIKSPTYRSSSTNSDYDRIAIRQNIDPLTRTQSAIDLSESKVATMTIRSKTIEVDKYDSSDDVKSLSDLQYNTKPDDNATMKKTKSVLKNASSISSLKKKVIFDMDAIQMKSLSATPSQSNTEKSDSENYELGLVNLDTEEWDISSIENEPLKNDTKLQLNTRTSPKIAELKKTIEAQLARRTDASSGLVGGVDVSGITKPITKDSNVGGSNTSLGSSILDESDSVLAGNKKAFTLPKKMSEREESELDISGFSIDGMPKINKNESF